MRTIDADALWKEFCKSEAIEERYGSGVLEIIGNIIDNALTIDAVPVVRCKDCKYNTIYEKGMWSEHHGCEVHNYKNIDIDFEEYNPLFFCGCGERKDNDKR